MIGTKKFYFPTVRVRLSLPAQRHTAPDGDRHPGRDLAGTGHHRSYHFGAYHRLADLEISARHWKMVRKGSGL